MRFSGTFTTLLPIVASALGATSSVLERRAPYVKILDSIVSPAANSVLEPGDSFAFQYSVDNWCEAGYTPLQVYLLSDAPTPSTLNSSEEFGNYLHFWGAYLVPNFGLPAMSNPPPPPSSFVLPELDDSYLGQTLYVSVIQTENSCPPDGHYEYGLSTNAIQYGSS